MKSNGNWSENNWSVFLWRFFGSSIVGLILPVFVGLFCCLFRCLDGWKSHHWTTEGLWSYLAITGTFGFVFFCLNFWSEHAHIFVTRLENGIIIYDKAKGNLRVIRVLDRVIFVRDNHPFLSDLFKLFVMYERHGGEVTVHPVTANPKVRDITCYLCLKVEAMTVENLNRVIRFVGFDHLGFAYSWSESADLSDVARSLLYDFAEAYSRDLGTLFNPLNEDQQARFKEWLTAFVNPKLAGSGLVVDSCSFSI